MITFYINTIGFEVSDKWVPGCWTCIECPTQEEHNLLLSEFEVPNSFLSDIDDNDERPRREEEDGWQLIVLRVPFRKNSQSHIDYSTVPLGIILKDSVFVTICNYKLDMLDDFVAYSVRKQIIVANHYELVMRLMLSSSVWFLKYLKHINIHMMQVQNKLQQTVRNKEIVELLRIENSLVYFITSLKGNDVLFYRMAHIKNIRENCNDELIEDVEIELKQAEETTNIYRNINHSLSNSYSSLISNNINFTMKQLTSITIILMLPTLIASLFGMNVPNYMENNPLAIIYIVGASVVMSLLLYLFMKKRDLF